MEGKQKTASSIFKNAISLCCIFLSVIVSVQDINLTVPTEALKTIIMLAMGFSTKKKSALKEETNAQM